MADEKRWTAPQQDCIDAKGGSVFVSAAAGSGKTAVLIERITTLICNKEAPLSVENLLVVTFTKAAATEMRSRLSKRLSDELAKDPKNRHLLHQQMLLPQANICTIHSFCGQIVREYATQLGVSPRFRIADDALGKLIQAEVAAQVVDNAYKENSADFRALCESLTEGIKDSSLAAQIQDIYNFIQAHPFPMKWLDKQERSFECTGPIEDTVWGQVMLEQARDDLTHARDVLSSTLDEIASDEQLMVAYGKSISRTLDDVINALDATEHSWEDAVNAVNAISFPKLLSTTNYEDGEFRDRIKNQRDYAKDLIVKTIRPYIYQSEADVHRDIATAAPMMRALCKLVREFDKAFSAAKAEQNYLDFNDFEHLTLSLLATPNDDGTFTRTELAKEIGKRFTHIMVDEYQDTNATQDTLFSALSDNESNLFFVGDIKQSIYGFRKAMPSIFRDRLERGAPYDRDNPQFPASIALGNNFRSRAQVTEATNFLFRRLMHRDTGGIVYDEKEELVASGTFPRDRDPAYDTELLILESERYKGELSATQAEARLIGERILSMIADGYQVTDGRDKTRQATYRDFCILMSSTSKNGPIFTKELQAMGIPVSSGSRDSFFACAEILTALSVLRTIDNPLADVPLTATLMSPIYGFSPDDMTVIRSVGEDIPLYTGLRRLAASPHPLSRRAADFLDTIGRYRTLAASLPADHLIRRLYEDTDMLSVMSAKSGSSARIANLRKLYDLARHFEDRDFKGLSAFIRHLDRLNDRGVGLDAASNDSSSQNAVRIMTIHGSKGLEFPVVFVARLSGKFNDQSTKGDVLMHADYGFGLRLRDRDAMQTLNPLHHKAIAAAITRSERTEALRLLYVAMTRPKDKLIMTLTPQYSLDSTLESLLKALPKNTVRLPTSFIIRTQNMQKWVLAALLDHDAGRNLFNDVRYSDALLEYTADGLRIATVAPTLGDTPPHAPENVSGVVQLGDVSERMDYRYEYAELGNIPAKITASQASHGAGDVSTVHLATPAFLSKGGLTPAQRGTATHLFFENVDLACGLPAEQQAETMVQNGILTDKQKQVLRFDRLDRFLESTLAKRMADSPSLWREFPFAVERPVSAVIAAELLPPNADGETIIVQGIADAVFEENGELIIVDYKTDRVTSGDELIERYRAQLDIYKDALAETLQKPVKEALIYSFHLNDSFKV